MIIIWIGNPAVTSHLIHSGNETEYNTPVSAQHMLMFFNVAPTTVLTWHCELSASAVEVQQCKEMLPHMMDLIHIYTAKPS